MKYAILAALLLSGCANLSMGWYNPNGGAEFEQDRYACMTSSQMRVTGASAQNSGFVTPGYGQWQGSASAQSYTTTNEPLFAACMRSRGYVWTSQAQVSAAQCTDRKLRMGEC